MSKILLDKQILLNRIAELEKTNKKYPLLHEMLRSNNNLVKELNSILQQSEEYNENEAVEISEEAKRRTKNLYTPSHKKYIEPKQEESNETWDEIHSTWEHNGVKEDNESENFLNWLKKHYSPPQKR